MFGCVATLTYGVASMDDEIRKALAEKVSVPVVVAGKAFGLGTVHDAFR